MPIYKCTASDTIYIRANSPEEASEEAYQRATELYYDAEELLPDMDGYDEAREEADLRQGVTIVDVDDDSEEIEEDIRWVPWYTGQCANGNHEACKPLGEVGCDCPCHIGGRA